MQTTPTQAFERCRAKNGKGRRGTILKEMKQKLNLHSDEWPYLDWGLRERRGPPWNSQNSPRSHRVAHVEEMKMGIFSILCKVTLFSPSPNAMFIWRLHTHFAVQSNTIKKAAIGPKIPWKCNFFPIIALRVQPSLAINTTFLKWSIFKHFPEKSNTVSVKTEWIRWQQIRNEFLKLRQRYWILM